MTLKGRYIYILKCWHLQIASNWVLRYKRFHNENTVEFSKADDLDVNCEVGGSSAFVRAPRAAGARAALPRRRGAGSAGGGGGPFRVPGGAGAAWT